MNGLVRGALTAAAWGLFIVLLTIAVLCVMLYSAGVTTP